MKFTEPVKDPRAVNQDKKNILFSVRIILLYINICIICTVRMNVVFFSERNSHKAKKKASSLDIALLTILNSGSALQPRKWQLTGNDCSTAAHAVAAQSPH